MTTDTTRAMLDHGGSNFKVARLDETKTLRSELCQRRSELQRMRLELKRVVEDAQRIQHRVAGQVKWLAKQNVHWLHQYRRTILTYFIERAVTELQADKGHIQVLDTPLEVLHIEGHFGFARPFLDFFASVYKGQAASGAALERRTRVIVEDVTDSPVYTFGPAIEANLYAGVRAIQATPLMDDGGRVVGVFSTHHKVPRSPAPRELGIVDEIARQVARFIQRISS